MSKTLIIGAGPAGLAAAYQLVQAGQEILVLEKDLTVGGISKTINYKGYYFDIGGHRFITKINEIQKIWEKLLGPEFLPRNRLSRIYHNQRFFEYPLVLGNVLKNINLAETFLILTGYLGSRFRRRPQEVNFEDYICGQFGSHLFKMFFKDYTEKIWGLPCHLISADWARQRIEGLSMLSVISSFFSKKRATSIRTLTRTFYYPPLGPGMLFEKMAEKISTGRNLILTGYTIRKIFHNGEKILKISATNHQGGSTIIEVDQIISSMPLTHFIESLQPPAPETVRNAARQLSFRNLLVVNLICANQDVFPDNWIYINSKDVLFGRIQNYKNWSPAMVPDSAKTSLGLEYFCSQTDPLWNLSKEQLFTLAKQELKKIGFSVTIDDGFIHRQSEAYPVYAMGYQEKLQTIKSYLKNFKNLQIIGRNGRFQYDNMDTSMATGLEAARKIDPLKAP